MSTRADSSGSPPSTVPDLDRAAALAIGAPKVPRRVVVIAFAVAALLAGLGVLGEDFFSSVGLNPVPATTPPVVVPTSSPLGVPQIDASLPAFMSITRLTPKPAPAVSLFGVSGAAVSLTDESGDVVVLTFFNASCTDICPVMIAELAQADADLGGSAARVVFLTVNTDALQTSVTSAAGAVLEARSSKLRNWHLLSAPLGTLNGVWRSYGIFVNAYPKTGIVTHSDALYFIDPEGRLRFGATPFADERTTGAFSLSKADIARWATGIAAYADELLREQR